MSVPTSPSNSFGHRSLGRFPAEVQAAHATFLATGEAAAADQVLLAVLKDHLPSSRKAAEAVELKDETRLIEDLGFDSLAIAEVVFFLEDLYELRIPQEHLQRLSRVGDLRQYLRTRLESQAS